MTKSSSDWEPVRYCVDTDTMVIELRPWPGRPGEAGEGEDAGPDLVIHYYPDDGKPWLWEIEHASEHPEHIAAALREMRGGQPKAHTINVLKLYGYGDARLMLSFDDDRRLEFHNMVDLSPLLGQGGIFEPLRDPKIFERVQIGPGGRTLVWRVGKGKDDIVDLSADVLWPMARPLDTYYREVAAQIRDLARRVQLPEVRSEMADLAERFARMGEYFERMHVELPPHAPDDDLTGEIQS